MVSDAQSRVGVYLDLIAARRNKLVIVLKQ